MVFNADSQNQDLCTLADSELGTDDVSFPLQRKALFASKALSRIWKEIYDACNGWKYVDKNDSSDPFSDVASVANTNKIALPAAAVDITGMAYLDTTTSEYRPLTPITEEEINSKGYTIHNYKNVAGVPRQYLPMGLNIYVYPALPTSTAAAYRVYHDRKSVKFAPTGNDTMEPGIETDFHPAVVTGMAYYEARRSRLPQVADLKDEWQEWLGEIGNFYRKRYKQYQSRIRTGSDYVRGME